jgi:hypothetical protein
MWSKLGKNLSAIFQNKQEKKSSSNATQFVDLAI